MDRINSIDEPKQINSIISLNPNITQQALALDRYYSDNNSTLKGRLHCVPLLVKDNIDIQDLITTGGVDLFNNNETGTAIESADIIYKLVDIEGAILIGKTNMAPLAMDSHTTFSEIIGECHNPYSSQNRTCYGSSGGTAAAITAGFGVIGIGTDTVGSITLPSSGANIFGVRPPFDAIESGVISMDGIMPTFRYSAVVGPMTRTLTDAAIVMDILMDNEDSLYFQDDEIFNISDIDEIRFGILGFMWLETVLEGLGFEYDINENVFEIQEALLWNLENMSNTELINVTLSTSQFNLLGSSSDFQNDCSGACYSDDWEQYLLFHGNFTTIEDIIESEHAPSEFKEKLIKSLSMDCNAECVSYFDRRDQLRNLFDEIYDGYDIDVIVFPGPPIPPFKLNSNYSYSEEDIEWSGIGGGLWPAYIGYPAIDIPIDFTESIPNDAPIGLPIGATFMSKPDKFDRLFVASYAYDQFFAMRRSPVIL